MTSLKLRVPTWRLRNTKPYDLKTPNPDSYGLAFVILNCSASGCYWARGNGGTNLVPTIIATSPADAAKWTKLEKREVEAEVYVETKPMQLC